MNSVSRPGELQGVRARTEIDLGLFGLCFLPLGRSVIRLVVQTHSPPDSYLVRAKKQDLLTVASFVC